MNKDLDERLVPKGEYRDAQNIQISTSEGSDVGAIEAMLGNTKLVNAPDNQTWGDRFGLVSPVVIGAARDTQNNKIYWFITSDSSSVDAILEYNESDNRIVPVIVDTRDGSETGDPVLNFNVDYLITGINIIDGMLFWTDDLNEPRKINIETFKAGSTGNTTSLNATTQVYGRSFLASDINVITQTPSIALTVNAYASIIGGPGTGITPLTTNSNTTFYNKEAGDSIFINWSSSGSTITWPNNSIAVLSTEVEGPNGRIEKYQVVVDSQLVAISNSTGASFVIISITPGIPNISLAWEMLLVEEEPIFKKDFPRFSYRYKYSDNKYSTYAPFTAPAFVPGKFEYLSRDGKNKGMESIVRKIQLSNFPTIPNNVEEIQVLYKNTRSNNVYLIETIEYDYSSPPTLSLDITSDTLGKAIESNQLLRLFDNVPKKAKAQEIIGNRIIYGNYVQGHDNPGRVSLTTSVNSVAHSNVGYGIPSVKTDRKYELGVSFIDENDRESPVFVNNDSNITFSKGIADAINKVQVVLEAGSAPSWASYFKIYIKNNTPEYYNLALDRYYDSNDGGVWLSFPSSERNKVFEGQYIILKKQHDSEDPVGPNNRYKILNVSNNAPDFLTKSKVIKARGACQTIQTQNDFQVGNDVIRFHGPTKGEDQVFYDSFGSSYNSETYIQFESLNGAKSDKYRVLHGDAVGLEEVNTLDANGDPVVDPNNNNNIIQSNKVLYEIKLAEPLKEGDAWLANIIGVNLIKGLIYEETESKLAEFQGRFFIKINPNSTFYNSVDAAFATGETPLIKDQTIEVDENSDNVAVSSYHIYWENFLDNTTNIPTNLPWDTTGNNTLKDFRLEDADNDFNNVDETLKYRGFQKLDIGVKFKFQYADGTLSQDYYKILNKNPIRQALTTSGIDATTWEFTIDRDYDDTQYSGQPTAAQLDKIVIYKEIELEDQYLLSSSNPAVFETEPDELADIDIYWEASDKIATSSSAVTTVLNWHNCYSFGNGVESDRIEDDFNASTIGKGVRVNSIIQELYKEERKGSSMIFSGIINSTTGVNESNQFLMAQDITKDLNPIHGTIQKLSARGAAARGDLIALCEDKVFKILANKDALFNADGNTNLTATKNVLGQAIPFAGEYGISTQPESFASFGFRSYFCDRTRRAVLRLSADGLTVISDKGLKDYFRDEWTAQSSNKVFGGYDEYTGTYHAKVQGEQVLFSEAVNGWVTRTSWVPQYSGISLNNNYYTFKNGELYVHNNAIRNNIYGAQESATVTAVLNDEPISIKNFKTLEYQGDTGWTAQVTTDQEKGLANLANFVKREGLYQTYIQGVENTWSSGLQSGDIDFYSLSILGVGEHSGTDVGLTGGAKTFEFTSDIDTAISIGDKLYFQDGNNIINLGDITAIDRSSSPRTITSDNIPQAGASVVNTGEFIFAAKDKRVNTSGIIGYYADVTFTNTSSDKSELFGIGSEVFISSE